jgi:hypothetical protein
MVPSEFANFFLGSAGAGGALVGLLFVAISVSPEMTVTLEAPAERRAVASSSFSALVNAFFLSLTALIPINIGWVTLVLSLMGISNALSIGWNLLHRWPGRADFLRRVILVLASLMIYGFELYNGLCIIRSPADRTLIYNLAILLLAIYGVGLVRAWQLLGARRFGLFGWLSPLYGEGNNTDHPATPRQPGSSSALQTGSESQKSHSTGAAQGH